MCAAEVLGLASYSAVAALLPDLIALWSLSNTQAGWLTGIFFAGYVAAVVALVTLTDRVSARTIYLGSTVLTVVTCFGFALADGFWTALLLRALAGAGLAGTYMPGLKALTDDSDGVRRSRVIAVYTSSFTIGVGASFILAGEAASLLGWRGAFVAAGICTLAAFAVAWAVLPKRAPRKTEAPVAAFDFRPVLRNRQVMAYVLGYCAVAWASSAFRSWIVVFLDFSSSLETAGEWAVSVVVVAAVANVLGVPAGLFGNEAGIRFGLRRAAVTLFLFAAVASAIFGFSAPFAGALVIAVTLVYGFVLQCNISNLTTGTVAAAEPRRTGATMAVHSAVGFVGAFAGPLLFGVVLDLAAGAGPVVAWGLAFASCGLVCVFGAIAIAALARDGRSSVQAGLRA